MTAVSPTPLADASLRALNTFAIDARARMLLEVATPADLEPALALAREAGGRPLVLGGGSNLLFTVDRIDRPVLRILLSGRRLVERGDAGEPDASGDTGRQGGRGGTIVEAAAGESWHRFVRWTLSQGLGGLENLALIPGTVGAAPIQNIGAYGVELRECFESLDAVHLSSGERRRFDAAECGFGYRDSVFRHGDGRRWLILGVRLRLSRTPSLRLDYGELREQLAHDGVTAPTPVAVADAVEAIRRRRLPDPALVGNAGSFFRNPVVDAATAAALRTREPGLPCWPVADGVKLSAAWMIERCGWKGFRSGDAGVHERHALVLVNHGRASGAEVLALARRIQQSVAQRYGVGLEPEPVLV
jgi:UDP-N-acetylmuramate dehydrogenase